VRAGGAVGVGHHGAAAAAPVAEGPGVGHISECANYTREKTTDKRRYWHACYVSGALVPVSLQFAP
jgi:hypothetical protein